MSTRPPRSRPRPTRRAVRDEDPATRARLRRAFSRGARAAAEHASHYDASTSHDWRIGDCILAKMNLRRTRPRRNRRRLPSAGDSWLLGFAAALAEVARFPPTDVRSILRIAREAGLTLDEARRVDLAPEAVRILRRAGLPKTPR